MRFFLDAAFGTAFTFFMTTLGAAMVFFFRHSISTRAQRLCFGFAAGVMTAASLFSLLNPAVAQLQSAGAAAWLPVTLGVLLGAGFLFGLNGLIARYGGAGMQRMDRRRALLFTAVTLHNIPEGMAVGLAFATAGQAGLAAAWALALGIGIQNFPEGAAIALPMRQGGMSRMRSFAMGALSGVVEPVFGMLVFLAARAFAPAMPGLMAFAAGAMLAVTMAEMIPEAAQEPDGAVVTMLGFLLMMALDVGLG